jgi:hypothetical protein
MSSAEDRGSLLDAAERGTLLHLARASIRHGLQRGVPLPVQPAEFGEALRRIGASFVTLEQEGRLRGCIGHLEAVQPLVIDVTENAYNAAFRDPRFTPVREDELERIEIEISLLSQAHPLHFASEEDLIDQLRPGVDGLILEDGRHRGTFLPSVWSTLPEPRAFLSQLKRKAGLPSDHWSGSVRVSRYTTESFGDGETA